MKPLHGEIVRLSGKHEEKCPCCKRYSRYSKHNTRGQNDGKSASRQNAKKIITKEQIE